MNSIQTLLLIEQTIPEFSDKALKMWNDYFMDLLSKVNDMDRNVDWWEHSARTQRLFSDEIRKRK